MHQTWGLLMWNGWSWIWLFCQAPHSNVLHGSWQSALWTLLIATRKMSILRIAKAGSKNLRTECHWPESSAVCYRALAVGWQERPRIQPFGALIALEIIWIWIQFRIQFRIRIRIRFHGPFPFRIRFPDSFPDTVPDPFPADSGYKSESVSFGRIRFLNKKN
jgi:hypothetical protein